jgi:hypothetical protein
MADGRMTVDMLNVPSTQKLHAAVCQAVALLNRAPEVARCAEGREAHTILRQALADYADAYMDQPAPEAERQAVACKHRSEPRGCYRVRCQLGRKCVRA